MVTPTKIVMRDVQVEDYLKICRALVRSGPSSLHMLGLLLSPCIENHGETREELLDVLSKIISSGQFHLKLIGGVPITSGGELTSTPWPIWGLAAVALGGGRGSTPARAHFWLSSECDISNDPENHIARASVEQMDVFRTALEEFFIPTIRSAGLSECMFHSLNACWKNLLGEMRILEVVRDNPCVKSTKLYHKRINVSVDSRDVPVVRSVLDSDVKTVSRGNSTSEWTGKPESSNGTLRYKLRTRFPFGKTTCNLELIYQLSWRLRMVNLLPGL
jgi:hypothetical protein